MKVPLKKIISLLIVFFYVSLISCNRNDNSELMSTDNTIKETTEGKQVENEVQLYDEAILESNDVLENIDPDEKYKAKESFEKVDNREKKDVLCFVGDIYLSRRPRAAYDERGIDAIVDEGYRKILSNSDLNIGNLECSITDNEDNAADKTFTFALPSKYAKVLKEIGINLFTLANNHILDFGTDAMINTINVLDKNGINHVGAGKNLNDARSAYVKEIDGKRYAVLNASAVMPSDEWKATDDRAGIFDGYNINLMCDEIKEVKPYVDKVIVYMHWGRELEPIANDWQKYIAKKIIDAGANLVVGTHAHITQEIEYYKGVPIVYSLGNFIYGGTTRDMILLEAVFDYSIDKNGQLRLIIVPGVASYEMVKRYWNKEKLNEIIEEIQDKSSTCYIGDNGYVFTLEEVNAVLNTLETSNKIN